MGSKWSVLLSVLDQSCSVSHLQKPNLCQNYLTKIAVHPDKTSHKLLMGPNILVKSRRVMSNKTYSTDGLFQAQLTFPVAGDEGNASSMES